MKNLSYRVLKMMRVKTFYQARLFLMYTNTDDILGIIYRYIRHIMPDQKIQHFFDFYKNMV